MPWMMMWTIAIGCSSGTWTAEIWGEDYAAYGIPAEDFDDGCSASFSSVQVSVTQAELLNGDGEAVASLGAQVYELVDPEPQTMGTEEVPGGSYDSARFQIAPTEGRSVHAVGTLSCGGESVAFDWRFAEASTYLCELEGLQLGGSEAALTQLTVHMDHLFYDGLANPEAALLGQAILEADADQDGQVTLEELEAVDIAPLGYSVGPYAEVEDLGAFLSHLTRTLGHVDGEGHCEVDL